MGENEGRSTSFFSHLLCCFLRDLVHRTYERPATLFVLLRAVGVAVAVPDVDLRAVGYSTKYFEFLLVCRGGRGGLTIGAFVSNALTRFVLLRARGFLMARGGGGGGKAGLMIWLEECGHFGGTCWRRGANSLRSLLWRWFLNSGGGRVYTIFVCCVGEALNYIGRSCFYSFGRFLARRRKSGEEQQDKICIEPKTRAFFENPQLRTSKLYTDCLPCPHHR